MSASILKRIDDLTIRQILNLHLDTSKDLFRLYKQGELVIGRYNPDQLSADNAEQFLTGIFRGLSHHEENDVHFTSLHGVFQLKAQNDEPALEKDGTLVTLSEIRGIGSTKRRSALRLVSELLKIGDDDRSKVVKHIPKPGDEHRPTKGVLYETVIDSRSPHHNHESPHLLNFNALQGLDNTDAVIFPTSDALIDGLHTHLILSKGPQ